MGQSPSSTQHSASSPPSSTRCPVDHSAFENHPQVSASSSCPVDHAALQANRAQASLSAASCPVDHGVPSSFPSSPPSSSSSRSSSAAPVQCPVQQQRTEAQTLDPRNHLPVLTQERAPSQTADLPTERTASSIPRDAAGNWEYPSPQQFYNALVRKGFETPENEVETMVQIHNFLNERAWDEVRKWETQINKCVSSPSTPWMRTNMPCLGSFFF